MTRRAAPSHHRRVALAGIGSGAVDLGHQVVAPGTLDPEMGGGSKLEGLDHVVIYVGVHTGLEKGVERRTRGTPANEPSLEIGLGRIGELAALPDIVAVPANKMRTRIPIGLRVYDQYGLADLCGHGILARQRAHSPVEHDVSGDERAHHIHGVRKGVDMRVVALEFALRIARNVKVLLAKIVDPVVAQRFAVAILEPVARQHHHDATHARSDVPGHQGTIGPTPPGIQW